MKCQHTWAVEAGRKGAIAPEVTSSAAVSYNPSRRQVTVVSSMAPDGAAPDNQNSLPLTADAVAFATAGVWGTVGFDDDIGDVSA